MGDQNTGGGGSVHWKIEVDKAEGVTDQPQGDKGEGRLQRGKDTASGSEPGNLFEISIEPPDGIAPDTYLTLGKSQGGRVVFELPIDSDNPNQIQIRWGRHLEEAKKNRVQVQKAVQKIRDDLSTVEGQKKGPGTVR